MNFTSAISANQSTTTAMISSTLPNGDDCKEIIDGFKSDDATKSERKDYAHCVQSQEIEEQHEPLSADPYMAIFGYILFLVLVINPLIVFTNRNR